MPARRGSTSSSQDHDDSSDGEQDYLDALTRKQVLEISEAFDTAATSAADTNISISSKHPSQPANKRRRLDKGKGKATVKEPDQAPGGFFVGGEDDDDDEVEASAGGFIRDTGTSSGGGFLLDDHEDDEDQVNAASSGGGFFPASKSPSRRSQPGSSSKPSKVEDKAKAVLLDKIPSVLESLGLDGDDTSILSIFENASFADPSQDGLQAVKRKDFFKVAAILITQRDNERAQHLAQSRSATASKSKKGKERAGTFVSSGGGKGRAVNMDADEVEDADEHDDSDPLILDSDDEDEEDDFHRDNEDSDPWADEDEIDGAFGKGGRGSSPPSKRRTTRSRAKETSPLSSLPSDDDDEDTSKSKGKKGKSRATTRSSQKNGSDSKYKLSSSQKEECNKMFQQFFPSSDKSRNKAITMAEIRYVATLLNEKISDDDVIEMLEYASNSRDRSVDLDAFSKIMVDVKAV
ncbi:hypothetical protein P389DRAFT_175125 [Cystobasidium minutum MCA 4210]|uniref:uncharacterized protein n=1 Tax=Cystobasidium minutum MCA 4210 TaxID=1397322 RepID=UPI0034CE0B24|eukprot:jgi/Rhomi1/175125/fgenesh1_kg.9_\